MTAPAVWQREVGDGILQCKKTNCDIVAFSTTTM